MTKYYLFRVIKKDFDILTDLETIKIDYSPTELSETDKIIVFVSETLKILGAYQKKGEYLLSRKTAKKEITLREFYDKLSIITEVGPRTYKVFAKKIKEITKEDYDGIMKEI